MSIPVQLNRADVLRYHACLNRGSAAHNSGGSAAYLKRLHMDEAELYYVYFMSWEATRQCAEPLAFYGTLDDVKQLCTRHFDDTRSLYRKAEIVRASEPAKIVAVVANPNSV